MRHLDTAVEVLYFQNKDLQFVTSIDLSSNMTLFPRKSLTSDQGKPKLIFLAGFPDNETSSWGTVLPEKFSADYDLYFLCLPGYEKNGKIPFWGYDFDQLVEFLNRTIEDIIPNEPCTLICHDWGAFLGLLYQTKFSQKVSKLILLDVGMVTPFTVSIKSLIYISMYQLWFVFSFLMSRIIGVTLGTILMGLFFIPIFRPLWPSYDRAPIPRKEVNVNKCYPYLYLWKDLLALKMPKQTFPVCPTLYMYGKQKNCMFHDEVFIATLNSRKDCSVKEIDAGHWLQITNAEEVSFEILKFLRVR